jgi:hypothetical protein
MAAGLGFKDFVTGEVLTAADVDGYLMQGVWVFDDATARDAAVTSPQEGNFAYLKDTNVTTYYTGSAWANLDTTGMTNPMTTTGDTIYSSSGSTPARLGIGTAGQVLQVNLGATAPEWATPAVASSGMTLISRTSFSAAASVTIDSLFSTTYENYLLCAQVNSSSNGTTLNAQGRYSTTTHTGANYQNVFFGLNYNANTLITIRASSQTSWDLGNLSTGTGSAFSQQNFIIQRPSSSGWLQMTGNISDQDDGDFYSGSANIQSNQAWSGLLFTPSSGTITGQITVYGLAK